MRRNSNGRTLDCFGVQQLFHVPKLSHGALGSGNALIQGENLLILESLLPRFEASVRCCYIDPPYNNQEKHYHYHDSRDHRKWLEETTARIEVLAEFLRDDGSLWISIDDREVHYLKVACDAIIGRKNFVTTIVWKQRTTRENRKVFSNNHEYILVYAKDIRRFHATRNSLALSPEVRARYKNPDNDPRGLWQSVSANAQSGHGTPDQFYKLVSPSGKVHIPPHGRCWIYSLRKLFPDADVFDTPKPETLICRVLEIASSPGDLILDAYLGSGTTAAVAHKCGRRYIGIEEGGHAVTNSAKRLSLVVDGDPSGISELVGWRGGGGFDFFRYQEHLPVAQGTARAKKMGSEAIVLSR